MRAVLRGATASVAGVDIDTRFHQKAQGCRQLLRCAGPFHGRARVHRLRKEKMHFAVRATKKNGV